jgi:cystinosin
MLSISQLIFDSWRKDDWKGISGDPVKFGLGLVSMIYDIIFMIQHYVL